MSDDRPDSQSGIAGGKSLYSISGIVIATILGSLAAGILLIYLNYLSLGYGRLAKLTIRWGIVAYALIITSGLLIPDSRALTALFIVLQTGLAGFAADRLQGAAINYHREHGGVMYSPLRAAGLGFLTGVAMLFALGFLLIAWTLVAGTNVAGTNP